MIVLVFDSFVSLTFLPVSHCHCFTFLFHEICTAVLIFHINPLQTADAAVPESVAIGDEAAGAAGAEPEMEGACGWSKLQTSLELMCTGQTDGVRRHFT